VKEYFEQEHFALRHLLRIHANRTNMLIVHTRTDQLIRGLPSLPCRRHDSPADYRVIEGITGLDPRTLVLQHVEKLRTESAIRAEVTEWTKSPSRQTLLLIIDMSKEGSKDHVNFVRCLLEQLMSDCVAHGGKKSAVLIVHYSPTSAESYPALFLDGCEHVFLDALDLGSDGTGIDVSSLIAHACRDAESRNIEHNSKLLESSCKKLLPRILPQLASQAIFYVEQAAHKDFQRRKQVIGEIFRKAVGTETFADIICAKFLDHWYGSALSETTRVATDALLRGTTQLSLSMSVFSTLTQSFGAFVGELISKSNHWRNLDLLIEPRPCPTVLQLFGLILVGLAPPPEYELLRHRHGNVSSRLLALPSILSGEGKVLFPFFWFVSSFLDHLVQRVVENLCSSGHSMEPPSPEAIFRQCLSYFGEERSAVSLPDASVVADVISFVQADSASMVDQGGRTLFDRYTAQFLEWKVGIRATKPLMSWLMKRASSFCSSSILAIHVVAFVEERDLSKLASLMSLDLLPSEALDDIVNQGSYAIGDLTVLFEHLERAWPDLKRSSFGSKPLSAFLLSLSSRTINSATHDIIEDTTLTSQIRRLVAADVQASAHDDFGLLSIFLSPCWLDSSTSHIQNDVAALIDLITSDQISQSSLHLPTSLLRAACGTKGGSRFHGFAEGPLRQINERLRCTNIAIFSPDGKRLCMPHFIPIWLRASSSGSGSSTNRFFSTWQHSFQGNLAECLYDMILPSYEHEAQIHSSAQLFLRLQREIESEVSFDKKSYEKAARLRAVGDDGSFRGSALAAMVISVRLVCFLSKVALEIATGDDSGILSSTYSADAINFIDELMSIAGPTWQSFFMNRMHTARGEGSVAAALVDGGLLLEMKWCRPWADSIQTTDDELLRQLKAAEDALAEVQNDEALSVRNLKLCPHCRQPFMVAQINCGQFRCGSDAHHLHGRANVNGAIIQNDFGCQLEFRVSDAQAYVRDEEKIDQCRRRVEDLQVLFERRKISDELWQGARALIIPPVVNSLRADVADQCSLLPHRYLLDDPVHAESDKAIQSLFLLLWNGASKLRSRLELLPDLVEVSKATKEICTTCSIQIVYFVVLGRSEPKHV
jgi:hypothetical protein